MRVKISKEELLKHIRFVNVGASLIERNISGPDFIELDAELVEKPAGDCVLGCRHGYHYCGRYDHLNPAPAQPNPTSSVVSPGECCEHTGTAGNGSFCVCSCHEKEKQKACCAKCACKGHSSDSMGNSVGHYGNCDFSDCPCHEKEGKANQCCVSCMSTGFDDLWRGDSSCSCNTPTRPKIEKLNLDDDPIAQITDTRDKINEIIDYVNKEV